MKIFAFILTLLVAGMVGFVSRWTFDQWQYWVFVAPICIYIGVISFRAANGYRFINSANRHDEE